MEDRVKKSKQLRVSLRFFVTVSVAVISLIAIGIFSYFATKMYYKNELKELQLGMESQCKLLSETLIDEETKELMDQRHMDSDIWAISMFFQGRIMIVDTNYKIVMDSENVRQNSYIINKNIIGIMTSQMDVFRYESKNYIEYMCPIIDENEIEGVIVLRASLDRQNRLRESAIRSNGLIAMIVMVLCVGLAYVLGWASTRGIKYVNQHIETAREGHVDEPIPEKGFAEFRTLTENYNKTISKLMKIDSSRQEFVSNVSHELKTPITSMKVLADSLVENKDADLSMYKEFMTDIVAEIDRESQIITDLLTLVKTDKDATKLELTDVDINELIQIIVKRVTPLAQARGIEISYESYRDVTARVDEVKLSLALSNIIENAVKYNIDNGWIKVTLNADHKNFHVKVADSGVGIPDDCKDQVFERFYRVDKARSRDTGGTGLGLSITRNIVRLHKGSIKLYSESGAGTTFTIKIPINMDENITDTGK